MILCSLQEHFENMCTTSIGLKPETQKKVMNAKIRQIRKMLTWLVDRLKASRIEEIMNGISALGKHETGYFDENPKMNAGSGIYRYEFRLLPTTFNIAYTIF